jgi:hypothetical protein
MSCLLLVRPKRVSMSTSTSLGTRPPLLRADSQGHPVGRQHHGIHNLEPTCPCRPGTDRPKILRPPSVRQCQACPIDRAKDVRLLGAATSTCFEYRPTDLLGAYSVRLEQTVGALPFVASSENLGNSPSWSSCCAFAYSNQSTPPAVIFHLHRAELFECPRTWTRFPHAI